MKSSNHKGMITHNAMNDFTEKDKVQLQYHSLLANKFKSEIDDSLELERHQALNHCLRLAMRDLSVWMIIIALIIVTLVISVQWIG